MKNNIYTYLVSLFVFFAVDLIWLGVVAQPIYDHFIGDFLASSPNWFGAISFYLLFLVGLNYFALSPAIKEKSFKLSAKNGALYGFFTYMTYELTNFAVLKDWPLGIVFIDIIWGTILGAATSALSYKLINKLI